MSREQHNQHIERMRFLTSEHKALNDLHEARRGAKTMSGLSSGDINSALHRWRASMAATRKGLRKACGLEDE